MSFENAPDSLRNLFRIEMNGEHGSSYKFKSFRLDVAERQLLNNGVEIALTPKAFDVLACLVERSGHLVEKDELMQKVWPDAFVEEANLTRTIHTLRKALGEDQNGTKYIATVAKKGYRFVADVEVASSPVAVPIAKPIIDSVHSETEDFKTDDAAEDVEKRRSRFFLLGTAVMLVGALLLAAFLFFRPDETASAPGRPVSIVVLPFRPIDLTKRDEANDLFFAHELINQLSQEKNLKVRQLSSVRGYLDVKQDALAIGREQKADYIVESNYFVANGRLRVTSKLFNVHLETIEAVIEPDADGSDLFGAVDDVVTKIGRDLMSKLRFKPLDLAPNRGTDSEQAWRHYVHGTMLNNKRRGEDSLKAVTEFENAVRIDPNFAEAYVGLAHAHESSYINGGAGARLVHCPLMTEAVDRAIELAPNLGEAWTMKAMNVRCLRRDQSLGEELHNKAVELAPNSAFVRRFRGIFLMNRGRSQEAIAELKTALDLDPNLPWTEKLIARALYFGRRYDEAIEQLGKTTQLDPYDPEQPEFMMMCYAFLGDFERAFEWLLVREAVKKTSQREIDSFQRAYSESGWQGVLRVRLARAEKSERAGDQNYGELASLAAQIGEIDKAFGYLEKRKAAENIEPTIGNSSIEPTFDPLRSDPRFERLLKGN